MRWWKPNTGRKTTTTVLPSVVSGMGMMSDVGMPTQDDEMHDRIAQTRGLAMLMVRPAHANEFRVAPSVGVQTFTAGDFGLLNTANPTTTGKLRVEVNAAIAAIHAADLDTKLRLAVSYGGCMALGAPATAPHGPMEIGTNTVMPSYLWATKGVNAAFGLDPFPLADFTSSSLEFSQRYIQTPFGVYDKTLLSGAAGTRLMCWFEQDLVATKQYLDEACTPSGSWPDPHTKLDHMPWNHVVAGILEPNSSENSRGYEATPPGWYPLITDGSPVLLGTDSGTTLTWASAPPTSGVGGQQWSPLLSASPATCQLALIMWDHDDPANRYEVFPITTVDADGSAAPWTTGTITPQSGSRLAFGPRPLNRDTYDRTTGRWTQVGTRVRMALCQWTGTGHKQSVWCGVPGLTGTFQTVPTGKINRSTMALEAFSTVLPLNVVNSTSMLMKGWDARENGLTWQIVERYPTDHATKPNMVYPTTKVFTGAETEQEVETLCCKAYARHVIDIAFMAAKALGPRVVNVCYLGGMYNGGYGQRWDGSGAVDMTIAFIESQRGLTTKLIPDNWFMARDTKRTSGGKQWPLVTRSSNEDWSASDAILHALALPGWWSDEFAGWERRFGFGWTSAGSELDGGSWVPVQEVYASQFAMWHWVKRWINSPAFLCFQFAGLNKQTNGENIMHTCEDVYGHDLVPVYLEGPLARYTANVTLTAPYGGWIGNAAVTKQQGYFVGSTVADPSVDIPGAALAVGRRWRDARGGQH